MTDLTGNGLPYLAPKLDPNCQCICHTQPSCQAPVVGDLIPLSDHRLAVALPHLRAGDIAKAYVRRAMHLSADGYEIERLHGHMAQQAKDAILAIADTDALAEVQTLRVDLDHAETLNRKLEAALSGGVLTKNDSRELLQELAVAEAEVARLTALMSERSQMLQGYDRMLKESAAREENWKAEVARLRQELRWQVDQPEAHPFMAARGRAALQAAT